MSRYPPGGALPPLQWGGDPGRQTSSRASSRHHNHAPGRRSAIDYDEQSPGGLVHRSMQSKEDMLSSSGGWQERQTRELIQDHIQTMTLAVKKLSAEIEAIESQLRNSELTSQYTTNTVKSLELQQAGSVNDLRSRVGRCDASIARLSTDMRQLTESVSFVNQQLIESNSLFTQTTSALETKITKLEIHMDKQVKDYKNNLQSVQDESKQVMMQLDDKTRNRISKLEETVANIQMSGKSEYKKLQGQLMAQMEDADSKKTQKLEELEKQLSNKMESLVKRLDETETSFTNQVDLITKSQQGISERLEDKVREKLTQSETSLRQDVDETKKRNDHALASLQESLETMRALLEGKQRLLEENLRKDMGKVKKMVILT